MKKIIAFATVLTLLLAPSGAFAVIDDIPGVPSRPGSIGSPGGLPGGAAAPEGPKCGDAASEGSVAGAAGGSGLSSCLGGLLGSVGGGTRSGGGSGASQPTARCAELTARWGNTTPPFAPTPEYREYEACKAQAFGNLFTGATGLPSDAGALGGTIGTGLQGLLSGGGFNLGSIGGGGGGGSFGGGAASCLGSLLGGGGGIAGELLSVFQNPTVGGVAGLVTKIFPGLTSQITSGATGLLNSALGSLGISGLSSSALSSVTSAISGGAAGIAGAAGTALAGNFAAAIPFAGALLGSADVPVTDETTHKKQDKDDTNRSREEKDAEDRLCILNPTVTELSRQVQNNAAATTIAEAAPYIIRNYGTAAETAYKYTNQKFKKEIESDPNLCSEDKQPIIEAIMEIAQPEEVVPTQSSCGIDVDQRYFGLEKIMYEAKPGNNAVSRYMIAFKKWGNAQQETSREVAQQQDQGYFAKGVCVDPVTGEERKGTVADCGSDFRANTPAGDIAHVVQTAIDTGPNQLLNSKVVGDNVNPQVANIANQLLSTLLGFIGLSQGGGGNQSVTGQISNGADAASLNTARSYLASVIDGNIQNEDEYQRTLDGTVRNLNDTKNAYDAVRQCYVTLSGRGTSSLAASDIALRIDAASSTVKFILDPQITARTQEYNDSLALIGELQRLKEGAVQAATAEELNAIAIAMDSLQASGLIHNGTDVDLLKNDAAAMIATLQTATVVARAQLAECQAL